MYAFDEYELDTLRFQLRRGGKVVPLEPKVFDVLRYLVEHHDRVATKRELLEALWPGEVVTEAVLPTNINAVRRALGQRRGAKTPIETVHGRGYRFTAPVTPMGGEEALRSSGVSGVREKAPDSAVIALADPEHEPFIGRRSVMSRLVSGLERGLSGDGQLWVLTGAAGIGKSRLAAQLATVALDKGATVWSGQCLDGEGAPAYWPWVQVLREALRGESESAIYDYLGSALPDIAALLPELSGLAGAEVPQPQLTGEQARFRLFDAVARFLARAGEARPRMVVLEDLHWADAPSLHLLKFVACAVPASSLVVVVTAREESLVDDGEFRAMIESLGRLRNVHRLPLGGLSEKDVSRYVEALTGQKVPAAVARSVQRRTDGNPLFVREMVRLVQEEQADARALEDADTWERQVPQAAVDVVRDRLARLPDEVRALLGTASVVGLDFELQLLESLLGMSSRQVLDAVDRAVDHRLIRTRSDRVGGYAFSHALVRDALYRGLTTAERTRLHARVAALLSQHFDSGGGDLIVELAHHAYRGLPETDADLAVTFTRAAAAQAETVHAYEDAVGWYRRAIDALSFGGAPPVRLSCELHLSLVRALQGAGRYQQARQHAQDVFRRALEHALDDLVVEAALAMSPVDTLRTPEDPEALDVLRSALAHLGDRNPQGRSRLLARLSLSLRPQPGSLATREEYAEGALVLAESSQDIDAELEALHARLVVRDHPDTLDEALALSDRLAGRALAGRRPGVLLGVHAMRFRAHLQLGELALADEANSEMLHLAYETRDVLYTWHAERHRALRALSRGEFSRAETMLGELAPVGEELHGRLAQLYSSTARVWLLRERGQLRGEVRSLRENLRPGFAQAGFAFRAQGLLLDVELGQLASARRGFEELAASQFEPVLHGPDHVAALAHLAEVCAHLEARHAAPFLYRRLRPYAALNAVDSLGHAVGGVHYFLGRLATQMGQLTLARQHLERAVDQNTALEMPAQRCRARWHLALSFIRDEGASRPHGVRLLEQCAETARQLGLHGLVDDIERSRSA